MLVSKDISKIQLSHDRLQTQCCIKYLWQPRTQDCLSTILVQGEDVLHFDWLTEKQNAKSKILESREIIIAKTNFRAFRQRFAKQQKSNYDSPAKEKYAGTKWQKETQSRRNKLYNMNLKLCELKNIREKKGV